MKDVIKRMDEALGRLRGPRPRRPRTPPDKKRKIRTWRVGEVGMEGTRLVLPGGRFTVCGKTYQSDRLIPFVGDYVFFHDDDPMSQHGELRHDDRFPGGVQYSLAIGACVWHDNGFVSMSLKPFLGRAWEVLPEAKEG